MNNKSTKPENEVNFLFQLKEIRNPIHWIFSQGKSDNLYFSIMNLIDDS